MASKADLEAGRAFVRLYLKNDMSRQLVRVLRTAQTKLRNFSRSALRTGRQIAIAGSLAVAPFVFATRTFAQFDDAMREVGAVTQATGEELRKMTDDAKKLGASTSFTAIQVALLKAELGRAGFVPDSIDQMTGSVLSLARATKTEGAQAAGIMATAIRQFALGAGDASRVADVLTTAANKSFNTLESLGESLKFVGPVAKDFNISLEDTVAVLGTLGNVGIQGTMAGTTMRRILLATGAEAKKLKRIFGVEFVDINGNVRPLVDTLQDIADATRDMGSAERAKKFKDAFGLRGITGASAIGRNITGTRDLRDAIGEAGGVAQKTADMMDAGLGGAFRILKSAIEGVQIAIGEALAPTLKKLAVFVTKTAQASIEWIKANRGIIVALAATAAGVAVLGVALMGLGVAALAASFAFGAVATVVSAVTSPLGALVALVAAGAVAWLKYSESGKRAWASLKAAVMPIIKTLKTTFGGVQDALMSGDWELAGKIAMAGLKLAFLQGLSAIQEAFPETFGTILRIVGKIGDGIVAAWGKVTGFLTEQWNNWGKRTLDTVIGVASRIPQIWQETVEGMANWMLKTSAKGGIMGQAISKVLGVDMGEEQAKAELAERESGQAALREFEKTAKEIEVDIAAGRATERDQRALKNLRAQIADIKAGGGTVDVLADAREAVKQYTETLMANVKAIGGEPGTGKVSESLEAFLTKIESGAGFADAANELRALVAEVAKQKQEAGVGAVGGPLAAGGPGAGGVSPVVSAAPLGVALTATYSAAAARIAGFQPGGGGPEKKMADGITEVAKNTREMTQLQQEFLAGMRVA